MKKKKSVYSYGFWKRKYKLYKMSFVAGSSSSFISFIKLCIETRAWRIR